MALLLGVRPRKNAALFFCGIAAAALMASGCGSKPVASVNGKALSDKEFARLCESATQVNPGRATVGMQVLAGWIQNEIMAQEAKRQNVYPSEKELEARLEAVRKQYAFTGQNLDEQLRQQGLTQENLKRDILNRLIAENLMAQGVAIPDAEIEKAFNERQAEFSIPEQVKISQITLDSEEKMKKARADLSANTQFSLVASTHSRDQFAQSGGTVPFPIPADVPPGGPVSQEVVNMAYKMKPGQVSDPVKVGGNWVIVRLDEKIPAKKPNLADVRELIRADMRQQKAQAQGKSQDLQNRLFEATRNAKIEVNRPEYQGILTQIQSAVAANPGMPGGAGPGAPPPAPPAAPGG